VAVGNEDVVTVIVGAATASVSVLLGEVNGPPFATVVLSVAEMLTGKEPDWVGVPEMTPVVVLRLSPTGRPVAAKV
jgi:hypothetical protein